MDAKVIIAKRVAQELQDGFVVNLGIGMPTLAAEYVPAEKNVIFHSENGFLGLVPLMSGMIDPDLTNAGASPVSIISNGSVFDSAMSFALIRGGHIDVTVLGGLEVDQQGNLANWMVPGKIVPGMGGAMDLVSGAKEVIVAMEHTDKNKKSKILKCCTLPLTGRGVVTRIITNLAVFTVNNDGLTLEELAPNVSLSDISKQTEADFTISEQLCTMSIM